MQLYAFTGADPRDYFDLGRIAPGDIVEGPVPGDGCWEPATAPLPTDQPPPGVTAPAAAPDASQEV